MSDQAKRRIQAIGQQLQGGASAASCSSGLPPIHKVCPGSSAARAQGKVVIITGAYGAQWASPSVSPVHG